MERFTYLCLFTSLLLQATYGQRENKFFRKDYHFIEATNSFYKKHNIKRNWEDAKNMCKWEGATLFYPDSEAESDAVRNLMKEVNELTNVWIGISATVLSGVYVTVDGLPVGDVYQKWAAGQPDNSRGLENCGVMYTGGKMNDVPCTGKRSFVCKKTLASLEWNTPCKMAYTGYTYNATLGKCYKFDESPKTWMEAYTICSSELSYLAVIDNQEEADFFLDVMTSDTRHDVQLNGAAHLGFHKLGSSWNTVKGTSVEDSEIFAWGEGQPDGGDAEQCGAMGFDGQFHDLACSVRAPFICEHEI